MPTFGFSEEGTKRIVDAVRRIERQTMPANGGSGLFGGRDYPTPMFPAKLTAACTKSGSVAAVIWGATQASTGAEASVGTSVTAYDWLGTGGSSGEKCYLFRHNGSGRIYFINGRIADTGVTPITNYSSLADIQISWSTTNTPNIAFIPSSVIVTWFNSTKVPGYSTSWSIQFLSRTSTGIQWTSPTTCS